MAWVSTTELIEDLAAQIGKDNERKISRKFLVKYSSTGDPVDAVEATNVPAIGDSYASGDWENTVVIDKQAEVEEKSKNATIYRVLVEYSNEQDAAEEDGGGTTGGGTSTAGNRTEGDVVYTSETTAASVHIQAIENTALRRAIGFNTDRTLNIGARKTQSGDEEVQGVDRLIPSTRLSVTYYLSFNDALRKIDEYSPEVGSLGDSFGPFSVERGGVVLVGCSMGEPVLGETAGGASTYLYPISINALMAGGKVQEFTLYDPNTGVSTVGSLVKGAWDYMWVYSEPIAVAGAITKVLPTSAYVDSIYSYGTWTV